MREKDQRFLISILTLAEGLAALIFYFSFPSENDRSGFLGFSTARWLAGLAVFLLWTGFLILTIRVRRWPPTLQKKSVIFRAWLAEGSRLHLLRLVLLAVLCACLEAFILTFLSLPFHLRPVIIWLGLIAIQALVYTHTALPPPTPRRSFWASLDKQQRSVFMLLLGLSLFFFMIIIPQNLRGAETPHIFNVAVNDENVTYVPLMWMFDTSGQPQEWFYRLIVYEDYHYGYPFYVISALVLLPNRLIFGPEFANQTQWNLLILRQMVSSLPMLVSTLLLVWMFTRFQNRWKSLLLYLLILFIPNAASYHIRFWHPDGLVVLAVVLTLFYLQRDNRRLGANFYLAAAACGLASAVKLYGFFFGLVIPLYLLVSAISDRIPMRKWLAAATGFVMVMVITILLCSPFLGVPSARERMLQIQTEKTETIGQGYTQNQPQEIYQTGLDAWLPFLEDGFGPLAFQGFLLVSLAVAVWQNKERLLNLTTLVWFLSLGFYLVTFSAVKSEHYWLPAMLPLYGAALNLTSLPTIQSPSFLARLKLNRVLAVLTVVLCLVVLVFNIYAARQVFTNIIQ